MIFAAEATSQEVGIWIIIAICVVNGLGALGGVVAFFATRREVQEIDRRLINAETGIVNIREEIADTKIELMANGERRSESLHRRIDPLVENTAALKAGSQAFTESFQNFVTVLTRTKQ